MFQHRQMAALLATRSWLVLSIVTLSWLLTIVVVGPKWSDLSWYEQACIAGALPLIVVAIVLARYRWTLWLTVIAMTLMGTTALVPNGGAVWTYPQTYFGYVGFILSMLLPARAGLVTSIAIPMGVWAIWLSGPTNVVPEAFTVANGSVQFLRALGAQLVLWWAWHSMERLATRLDDQWDSLRESELRAVEEQERSVLWRDQAARVHATMLNSINALVQSQQVDPDRLRMLASQGRTAIEAPPAPDRRTPQLTRIEMPVNAGIVLLTSALVGALIGGVLYPFFIPYSSLLWEIATIGATLVGSAIALFLVLQRRRLTWLWGCVAVLIPASVPWILGTWTHPCDAIGAVSASASVAGFAIVCIGLWSGVVPFVLGILVWAVGALQVSQATEASCRIAPTVIVLNVATFLPLAVIFTLVGMRFVRRSRDAMERVATSAELEERRAAAIARIDAELSASVREAADEFDAIAARGAMDDADVVTLECIAARLRLCVQVDVGEARGFTKAAYDIVMRLSHRRVPIEIGVLNSSVDSRPVPQSLVDLIVTVGTHATGHRLRIQSLGSVDWDFLSVIVPADSCQGAGLAEGDVIEVDQCTFSVVEAEEREGDVDMLVLTLERVVPVPALMSSER